jgi:3D (Asp-Asp-Asp) domain-containing protein
MQDAGIGDAAGTTITMEVTFYGWADNSPPGNAIAYPANAGQPTIHNAAGGTGTYADPITFATAPTEFSPGARLYVPFIEKYVVMEDSCGQCTTDWTNSRKYHIDLWMNSNGTESANALMNCEGSWTRTQTNVEINPPPTRVVTTPPLFDPPTNMCRTSP